MLCLLVSMHCLLMSMPNSNNYPTVSTNASIGGGEWGKIKEEYFC